MRRMLRGGNAVATAVAVLAVVAVGGAYAATGGGGTITICVHNRGGGLYLANKCARRDRRVRWSLTGPPGAPGPTGPQGPQGPVGAAGTAGAAGTLGAPATRYFAQINSDGTVNASGSPVSVDHFATGVYLANFGIDVTHCTALANQGGVPVFFEPGANMALSTDTARASTSAAAAVPSRQDFPAPTA